MIIKLCIWQGNHNGWKRWTFGRNTKKNYERRNRQGRGLATEALKKVLDYLTENERIACVTAWCAAENTGSRKVLEKAGMKFFSTEQNGLTVGDKAYDKLMYEYS